MSPGGVWRDWGGGVGESLFLPLLHPEVSWALPGQVCTSLACPNGRLEQAGWDEDSMVGVGGFDPGLLKSKR